MRGLKTWVETDWCLIVYHPYIPSLQHREVVHQDLDFSHPNIAPLPDLGQLDALLFCHFLVSFKYLWLEKQKPWYLLTLILSIPDANTKTPLAPSRKIIWILPTILTMNLPLPVPNNQHQPPRHSSSLSTDYLVVITLVIPQSTHSIIPPPLSLDLNPPSSMYQKLPWVLGQIL